MGMEPSVNERFQQILGRGKAFRRVMNEVAGQRKAQIKMFAEEAKAKIAGFQDSHGNLGKLKTWPKLPWRRQGQCRAAGHLYLNIGIPSPSFPPDMQNTSSYIYMPPSPITTLPQGGDQEILLWRIWTVPKKRLSHSWYLGFPQVPASHPIPQEWNLPIEKPPYPY